MEQPLTSGHPWPLLPVRPKEQAFHGAPEWAGLFSTLNPSRVAPCMPRPALSPAREDPSLLPALELSLWPTEYICPHRQPGSPASDRDPLSPETVPPSQPSCGGAASPRRRKEDDHQAPSIHEQDGLVGGRKSPAEREGAGEMLGPVASCRDLGGSVDVVVDPPGTVLSRSPTSRCLLTSSDFADLSSGPDPARVGHKRKVRFPSGNAEKRPGVFWPQASLSVSRALSPCGTRTTDGRHLFSLPLPGPESRPLTSPLPLCYPQTSLSLPDPFPWQPSDRPAELWATQPPWPGGGYSPGSEGSECVAPGPSSQQTDRLPSCSAAPGQLSAHLHSAAGT